MAFSCTAPIMTVEEEESELLALSNEEKEELKRDLYGITGNDDDNDDNDDIVGNDSGCDVPTKRQQEIYDTESISRGIELMQEHLATLSPTESCEYYEACERVPSLVEKESNPIIFLECESYNPWVAASRLAMYWKCRKDFFGPERAFLSMTLHGAMLEDVPVLRHGIVQILPNDTSGRPILFWDRIRSIKPIATRENVLRIAFYFSHVLGFCHPKKDRSVAFLCFVKGYDLYQHFDRKLIKKIVKLEQATPVQFKAYHFFTGGRKSVMDLILPFVKQMIGKKIRLRYILHAGTDEVILNELATYGIVGDHLNPFIRGTYKFNLEQFLEWVRTQEGLESILERNINNYHDSTDNGFVKSVHDCDNDATNSSERSTCNELLRPL